MTDSLPPRSPWDTVSDRNASYSTRITAFTEFLAERTYSPRGLTVHEVALAIGQARAQVVGKRLGIPPDLLDGELAADEALIELFDNAPTVQHPMAWLRMVIRNKIWDQVRAQGGSLFNRVEIDNPDGPELERVAEAVLAPTARPATSGDEEDVEHERRLDNFYSTVLSAIHGLSAPLRVVAYLYFVDSLTPAEIAEHLKLKGATVRKRLQRAREQLQTRLGDLTPPTE